MRMVCNIAGKDRKDSDSKTDKLVRELVGASNLRMNVRGQTHEVLPKSIEIAAAARRVGPFTLAQAVAKELRGHATQGSKQTA